MDGIRFNSIWPISPEEPTAPTTSRPSGFRSTPIAGFEGSTFQTDFIQKRNCRQSLNCIYQSNRTSRNQRQKPLRVTKRYRLRVSAQEEKTQAASPQLRISVDDLQGILYEHRNRFLLHSINTRNL